MIKEYTFETEDIPGIDPITLDLEYSYYFKAAKLDALPEDCYPEEEESEITLPKDFEAILDSHIARYRRELVTFFENKVREMNSDGMPKQWDEKAAREYEL